MNRDRLSGICTQFKGGLKEGWGRVRGDPTSILAGKRDRLAGRILEQRGIVKEATERDLNDFLCRNRNWRQLSDR